MKNRIVLLICSAVLCSSFPVWAMGADPQKQEDSPSRFSQGLKKISDTFYVGQVKPDLWGAMERIDGNPERISFWEGYVKEEIKNHEEYKRRWHAPGHRRPQGKGFLHFTPYVHLLNDGQASFETSIRRYSSHNELWIAYISRKEFERAADRTADDIQMAVTVLTVAGAPMVVHMGINRSFGYMLKAWEAEKEIDSYFWKERNRQDGIAIPPPNPFPTHPGLAMLLHSMAAKVMESRDPQKLYMITSPVPIMRDIMLKAFPHRVAVGVGGDAMSEATMEASAAPCAAAASASAPPVLTVASICQAAKKAREDEAVMTAPIKEKEAAFQKEIEALDKQCEDLDEDYAVFKEKDKMVEFETLHKAILEEKWAKEKSLRLWRKEQEESLLAWSNSQGLGKQYSARLGSCWGPLECRIDNDESNLKIVNGKLKESSLSSPIRKSAFPRRFQILALDGKTTVFDHVREFPEMINASGQTLIGDETKSYSWFYHRDMTMNPYIAISLEDLANHLQLMDVE